MKEGIFTNDITTSDRGFYTPSSFEGSSLLYLQEIGSLKVNKPHILSRSNLGSFLFLIVENEHVIDLSNKF